MSALPSLGRADEAALGVDATRTLYERHGSRIFAFCRSRLGSREEAEDATQTTFLNAFRSLNRGVQPQFELSWLFRIADNVCRDRRKSAWRRGRFEADLDLQDLQDVVAAPEHAGDSVAGLGEALDAMPERQRRAIVLREWRGLSYAEIAADLGVSKAAVETLIFRARRSLARGLEAPVERRKRAALDPGWLLALGKSLFAGGGVAKVAATVAAVTGAGLVVAAPLRDGAEPPPAVARPAPATSEPARPAPGTAPATSRASRRPVVPPPRRTATRPAVVPARPRPASDPPPLSKVPAPARGAAGKARPTPAAEAPATSPDVAVAPSTPLVPPVAEPPAPPPLPPPSATLPEVPELPAVPPVAPPLPDLPVDVPELPPLPPLP